MLIRPSSTPRRSISFAVFVCLDLQEFDARLSQART
jgi:hypothetical protein